MKTINKIFLVCLLALSTITVQASVQQSRSNFLPQLNRNQQVQVAANSLLIARQHQTSPALTNSASITPVTAGFNTPSPQPGITSPLPIVLQRPETPRSSTARPIPMNAQACAHNLTASNTELSHENNMLKDQLKALASQNKTLLYKTKTQQDILNNRNGRIAHLEAFIENQDVELVQQSNKIILLQIRIAQLTANSTAITKQ